MALRESVYYINGARHQGPDLRELTLEALENSSGFLWLDLEEPGEAELRAIETELDLHDLAVEDAIHAHQRSKLERYDDLLFLVLHTAHWDARAAEIDFNELHVFVAPDFVVTLRHSHLPELDNVRNTLESEPETLRRGTLAVLHGILDMVVDEYRPIVNLLEDAIDDIEDDLFGGDGGGVSHRIYELSREVITFNRAAKSLVAMTSELESGAIFRIEEDTPNPDMPGSGDPEVRRLMRDVHDHAIAVADRAEEFRQVLVNLLNVHGTLVAQQQNEEMRRLSEVSVVQGEAAKRISSWAAIFFAPALIAGIYGMNFNFMPELHWRFGYLWALGLMVGAATLLYRIFKNVDWL